MSFQFTVVRKIGQKTDLHIGGNGGGSVSKVVASDIRGQRFESRHRQSICRRLFTVNCIKKTKITKKRPGMAHFFKKNLTYFAELEATVQPTTVPQYQMNIKPIL